MPRRLLALLVPPSCWSCGAAACEGEPLCGACDAALPWLGERTGATLPALHEHERERPRPGAASGAGDDAWALEVLWTPLAFEGPARDLVHALKFRRAPGLAAAMARDMLDGAPRDLLVAPAALVPVPAHRWRRRARGFDHAQALADALGAASGRPVLDALKRGGDARARQRGLRRAERLAGAGLAVRVRSGRAPRAAVLVDDVCTTGATLAACASALRAAGTSSIAAIAYARAL